jgi:hypothetical protein
MRIQHLPAFLFSFISILATHLTAQPCTTQLNYRFGNPGTTERGYSIVGAPDNQSYYLSALYEDRVLLLHLDLDGSILNSRSFDISPTATDHGNMVMMDDEGMLVFQGMTNSQTAGGNVITFRYDPVADEVLWAKEFDTQWERNYGYGIIQLGQGGDFVINNNPHDPETNDDSELMRLEKNTGNVVPSLSTTYDMVGNSETMAQLEYYQGFIYGAGRYTVQSATSYMRNTLTKIDPTNGNTVWAVCGHKGQNDNARLYAVDLVIQGDHIYSLNTGDPNGVGGSNWRVYLQCTTLDGDVQWIKEYDIAGTNDVGMELVYSDGGIVALVHQRGTNNSFTMFKTDLEGNVLWATQFPASTIINTAEQMIALGNKIIITGTTRDDMGNDDILVMQTNSQGIPDHPCVEYMQSVVTAIEVANPVFFEVTPTQGQHPYETLNRTVGIMPVSIDTSGCTVKDTVYSTIEVTICDGETFEGYSATGTYEDIFTTSGGCDSIRTLFLTIEACQPDCGDVTSSSVYGSGGIDEHGRCILRSDVENAVYIAGNREQNTILIKMEFDGDIVWTREFDIVPDDDEIPAGLIEDTDGMLVISGTGRDYDGGTVYAFRYNPNTDQVQWAREYQTTNRDYNYGVIEKVSNGNYILNNQPTFPLVHDAQVMEIDRTTGNFVFAKDYRIIGTETLYELVYHNNAIYGVGRYKDGGTNDKMRHTLVKLDQTTFEQQWVKLGFRPEAMDARLYGGDMVIHNNHITSLIHGDPSGTSVTNTKVYIQQTSLDGALIWLRQYELPGNTDFSHEILSVGDGYVVLVYSEDQDIHYTIKINDEGNVLWGRKYTFNGVSEPATAERGNQLMIEAGSQLMFTGGVVNALGDEDILIIRTDLEGNIVSPCGQSEEVVIQSFAVDNPAWYNKEVPETEMTPTVTERSAVSTDQVLAPNAACAIADTLMSELEITICQGQLFEGYSEPGLYQDTFVTAEGCDSIRILTLTVTPPIAATISREICSGETFMGFTEAGVYIDTFALPDGCDSIRTLRLTVFSCEPIVSYDLDECRSYMSDGSIMDYSEFDPEYPNALDCGDVAATNLFRDPPAENKHSCTEGLNGTVAMCISSLSTCTYLPGDDASAVFEVTFSPDQDSVIAFNKLEFYEKAPSTYSWIDGPNGPNNYPGFYGIRILKDGVEIFEHHDINTSLTWALQSHAFNNIPEFKITEEATFRIELLPYCPIGNGALVSAWDLEDIRVFASCAPANQEGLMIDGTAATWNETPVYKASIVLKKTPVFGGVQETETASTGYYQFTDVARYHGYSLSVEKNSNLLQGINTIDIITLQKHLLGKRPFIAFDQYIAGDINHDGVVNALDMIQLRKALLGIIDEFPNNTSWRFAVQPVDMDSRDMNDFVEKAFIESLSDPTTIDWLGVKIGDVNRDAGQYLNGGNVIIRSANTFALSVDNATMQAGEIKTIEFKADDYMIMEGMQLAMEWRDVEIISVQAGAIPISQEHYHVDASGTLRISWSNGQAVETTPQEVVFSITIRSLTNQMLTDRVRVTSLLAPEAYAADEVRPVTLSINSTEQATVNALRDIVVMPNPFASSFVVNFNAPVEGNVSIVVFTTLGEQVYQHEAVYEAGASQHRINLDQLKGSMRILFCQLNYGGTTHTLKVVKQE